MKATQERFARLKKTNVPSARMNADFLEALLHQNEGTNHQASAERSEMHSVSVQPHAAVCSRALSSQRGECKLPVATGPLYHVACQMRRSSAR